jgi:hypothetical protein
MLMTRCEVRIRAKFQEHKLIVLQLHVQNCTAKNIGVILPKIQPGPNQASRHKYPLSITLMLLKKNNSEPTHLTYEAHVKCGDLKQVTHRLSPNCKGVFKRKRMFNFDHS